MGLDTACPILNPEFQLDPSSSAMIDLLIVPTLVLVIAGLAWRSWRRRAAECALPGRSPETAICVRDYSEIDVTVGLERCPCGGRFVVRGEGPVRARGSGLRMTRIECRRCARERVLYFDLRFMRR
jgi:hypothetical protein